MSGGIAVLCPGQGAQHAGMFTVLGEPQPDRYGLEAALGMPLAAVLADPALPYANRNAQPLLVAATLAAWDSIADAVPRPVFAAGYSIGEVAAHAVAGALDGGDAIALAARRAALMDAAIDPEEPHGLLAVSGLRLARLAPLLEAHGLHPAILNGADAVIVGGLSGGLAALEAELAPLGAHTTRLPVEVASHTPLLRGAAQAFRAALETAPFRSWRFPVLAGIDAAAVSSRAGAIDTLSRQLAETVRWIDCMDALAESGIAAAIELGPGGGLARMFSARHPGIACRSLADFRSRAGFLAWLERQL
jgi:[acyl-carrier-protein] S-malonyltransferase